MALGARSWTQPETEVSDVPSQGRRATEGWASQQVEENLDAATAVVLSLHCTGGLYKFPGPIKPAWGGGAVFGNF